MLPPGPPGDRDFRPVRRDPLPGDWQCGQCRFSNFASRTECKQCGAPVSDSAGEAPSRSAGGYRDAAPADAARRGDWACSCGFRNFMSRDTCRQCGESAPGGGGGFAPARERSWSAGPRSGGGGFRDAPRRPDWMCACGFRNFGSRSECKECGAPDSESTGPAPPEDRRERGGFRDRDRGGRGGRDDRGTWVCGARRCRGPRRAQLSAQGAAASPFRPLLSSFFFVLLSCACN